MIATFPKPLAKSADVCYNTNNLPQPCITHDLREVFLTTELTIYGFGADGDSAHESVKEHKKRLFSGVKTAENCYKSTKTKPLNRFGTKMAQVRFLSFRPM